MNRRDLLQKSGIVLATPVALGMSGCSGGGDGDDDGGSGDGTDGGGDVTPSETATPMETAEPTTTASDRGGEYTKEEIGEVVADEVEELEILGWRSEVISDQSIFQVKVMVRNAGDQETRITPGSYALVITYYDESGSKLSEGRYNNIEDTNLPSGETMTLRRAVELENPGAVASYDISLTCEESMGTYC